MRLSLFILAIFTLAAPVAASDCLRLQNLDAYFETGAMPTGAACATYLSLGGSQGVSCQWEFPLRDKQAMQLADRIWGEVTQCRPGAPSLADQKVNHPDSYELREWITESGIYSVSVKDKGGQNRTLTFLRLERSGF